TVTATSGTAPNQCTSTFTVTVTVNPKPSIANIASQACSGSAFSVTPSSTAPNVIPTGTTYSWSAPAGTGFTGGALGSGSTITGTLTNSGASAVTATYTVTATSGTAPNQCTSTFTVTVTVNPTNTFSTSSTNPTVCNGINGTITLSGLQNNTIYTYTLNGGSATSATSNGSGQILISSLSATTYSIVVTNPSTGCSSASQSVSLTNPGAPDITDITDQVLCGGSYTLPAITGTNLTGSSPAYYTGSNGSGTTLTAGAAISSTQTIYIYAVTGGGCSDQETFTVTVNSLPTISGTLPVCVGLTTQLTGSGTPNAITPWTSASPAIATISSTGLVTGIAAGTSVITYKDINGCQITATVTVNGLPTFTTSSTNPTVCNGTNGTITLSGLQNTTNYTYSLNGGTATAATSNGSGQIVISNLASGSYVVGITLVSTGCQSATQTVTLTNPNSPNVTDITDQVLCGGSYTLPSITGTNLTGSNPSYYTGSNGTGTLLAVGSAISSTQTIYIYAATPGGCSDQETFTVTVNSLPT
ncbi:MAG: Ig-like domain-containing protein, partial [Dolichospermum sp.]